MDARIPTAKARSKACKLTEEELKGAFKHFDVNDDGVISVDELIDVLRWLGQNPTMKQLADTVDEFDKNGNGVIDFEEFMQIVADFQFNTREQEEEDLRTAFQVFDKDRNGYISAAEFKFAMTQMGEQLSDDEVEEMIKQADIDEDGRINYQEFVEMILLSADDQAAVKN